MKDLAILIPCWKGDDYLPVCLEAIKRNCKTDYEVFVILNEATQVGIDICAEYGAKCIPSSANEGTLAVDHAIPFLKGFKYVANLNIDMIVCPDWDKRLLERLEEYGPLSSVSSPAIEYSGGANGLDTLNDPDLPAFTDPKCIEIFSKNCNHWKYSLPDIISQRHPVITSVENYLAVGGYSDNWDRNYFPGYSLDFDFPFRLWKQLGITKMVSCGDAPVLHDYSSTMNKLPPNLKANNCWAYFKEKNGMSIDEFKRKINFNKIVN